MSFASDENAPMAVGSDFNDIELDILQHDPLNESMHSITYDLPPSSQTDDNAAIDKNYDLNQHTDKQDIGLELTTEALISDSINQIDAIESDNTQQALLSSSAIVDQCDSTDNLAIPSVDSSINYVTPQEGQEAMKSDDTQQAINDQCESTDTLAIPSVDSSINYDVTLQEGQEAIKSDDNQQAMVSSSVMNGQCDTTDNLAIPSVDSSINYVTPHEGQDNICDSTNTLAIPSVDTSMNNVTPQEGQDNISSILIANSTDTRKRPPPQDSNVIELLDDSDDDIPSSVISSKYSRTQDSISVPSSRNDEMLRYRPDGKEGQSQHRIQSDPALASYHRRNLNLPHWMTSTQQNPGANLTGPSRILHNPQSVGSGSYRNDSSIHFDIPLYFQFPSHFKPSWENMTPMSMNHLAPPSRSTTRRNFQLSLLNVNEFTITGLSTGWNAPITSVLGLRAAIKKISREHGKASWQRDKDDETEGKWRIPLGAYHALYAYLKSDPLTLVEGIPQKQLQIASLEKARQEKGYPEAKELVAKGIPPGLANALAPFQRGGVDFVLAKHGRALIADDMGLGKTIQGIASIAAFHEEWPVLVLCPSGARYHWESEFRNWLGIKSAVNLDYKTSTKSGLLKDSQIHVVLNSKAELLSKGMKVVICSYGLAPTLALSEKLKPGMFRCGIVDESHMLKNKLSQRTATLVPVLRAMNRCVLLSGTPALARPAELWPQLSILGTEKEGWWNSEEDFMDKYVRHGSAQRSAELHTMLRGTVMIRRLKNDILKTLPKKFREKGEVQVLNQKLREKFKGMLLRLRAGKGQLAKLARLNFEQDNVLDNDNDDEIFVHQGDSMGGLSMTAHETAKKRLDRAMRLKLQEGKTRIQQTIDKLSESMSKEQQREISLKLEMDLRLELEKEYNQSLTEITEPDTRTEKQEDEPNRTAVLSKLYAATGDAKCPLIVEMLKRWLADPTKGKLCIFAHHISVLDSLEKFAGLSNDRSSKNRFIRIDGSTLPKLRQQQINMFQTDPLVRIALLGITAAGVAVTLTASSTVWFAELFWTPAIMIQAEDRCHRIGQQARVKCLYIVAKGTIDDLLWKLIEKKFTEIGEFVEGKEKLKLVVDNVIIGAKELLATISNNDDEDDNADLDVDETDELQLDGELEHDIEELGHEEERMLRESEVAEDSGEGSNEDAKPSALEFPERYLGNTEDAAIALSDDESETSVEVDKNVQPDNNVSSPTTNDFSEFKIKTELLVPFYKRPFEHFRVYRIYVRDMPLGVEVKLFNKRIIVGKITTRRYSKPSVGDVLVEFNGVKIPLVADITPIMKQLKALLQNPPVELIFMEIPDVIKQNEQAKVAPIIVAPTIKSDALDPQIEQIQSSDAVIDLVDDD